MCLPCPTAIDALAKVVVVVVVLVLFLQESVYRRCLVGCDRQNDENRVDVAEGQTVRLRLQRSVYTSGSVTVRWTTTAHQAGALTDYSPHRGSVSFTTGQHTADISLTISDDQDEEDLEVSPQSIDSELCILSVTMSHDIHCPVPKCLKLALKWTSSQLSCHTEP